MESGQRGHEATSRGLQPAPSRVYGPVPSRRLGRSLGVDIVPFKTCPYNCVYCQLGPTTNHTAARASFFPVADILAETLEKTAASRPDFITVAGSGEPTLCTDLGTLIEGTKTATDVPVAVLTNGALFGDPEVRKQAAQADVVLPSLDAGDEAFFRWVNRPVAGASAEAERILALLRRRPCTLEDVCAGLGTAAPGTLKVLSALVDDRLVQHRLRDGRIFYQAVQRTHGRVAERDVP